MGLGRLPSFFPLTPPCALIALISCVGPVVIPEFVVMPDCIDAFLALARDDASHSVADEPGGLRID